MGPPAIQGSVPASPEFPAPYKAGRVQRDAEVGRDGNADVVIRRDPMICLSSGGCRGGIARSGPASSFSPVPSSSSFSLFFFLAPAFGFFPKRKSGGIPFYGMLVQWENILSIVYGIAWILGAIGAALSVIYVVYSGYLFMSSQGDPQRMAQARTSIIGVAIGLVLIGGAFIIPTTISRYVIEPAGGVRVEPRAGADCDGVLKDQLVVQRTASTSERMQFLISQDPGPAG